MHVRTHDEGGLVTPELVVASDTSPVATATRAGVKGAAASLR